MQWYGGKRRLYRTREFVIEGCHDVGFVATSTTIHEIGGCASLSTEKLTWVFELLVDVDTRCVNFSSLDLIPITALAPIYLQEHDWDRGEINWSLFLAAPGGTFTSGVEPHNIRSGSSSIFGKCRITRMKIVV